MTAKKYYRIIKTSLMALAILITSTIAVFDKLDFAFFSIVTAYVLIQVYFLHLTAKGLERFVGTAIAFILIFSLILLFHHQPIVILIFAALLTTLFAYFYARDHHSHGMLLGAITIGFLSTTSLAISPDAAIALGIGWVSNILIGVLTVIFIELTLMTWLKKASLLETETSPHPSFTFHGYIQLWREKARFDKVAWIVAVRVMLTMALLILINHFLGWSHVDVQAIIAGIIVSAQVVKGNASYRALLRITGVVAGAILAIFYAHLFEFYPSPICLIVLITLTLTLTCYLSECFPYWEYALLQTAVMIPLILMTSNQETINSGLAIQRALGSIEGGIMALLLVYLSQLLIKYL